MIEYVVKDAKIALIRIDEEGNEILESFIAFENIVYLEITVDKETNRPFILTVTSPELEYSIESDDNASLLEMYQSISPYLLEKGFNEKEEELDDDFSLISISST